MDNPLDTERLEGRKLRVVVAEVINPLKLSVYIWSVLPILADFQPFPNLNDLNRAGSELTTSVTILLNRPPGRRRLSNQKCSGIRSYENQINGGGIEYRFRL